MGHSNNVPFFFDACIEKTDCVLSSIQTMFAKKIQWL